jgi:hypothetical protein
MGGSRPAVDHGGHVCHPKTGAAVAAFDKRSAADDGRAGSAIDGPWRPGPFHGARPSPRKGASDGVWSASSG